MKKNTKKQAKRGASVKKQKKTVKTKPEAAEYVGNLVELHRVQGVVLRLLQKSI